MFKLQWMLSKGVMMHESWTTTQTHYNAWSLTRPQKSQDEIFFVSMIRSVMSVFSLFMIHIKHQITETNDSW